MTPLYLQVIVFPVLAARHPDLSDVSVHRRRPQGNPGCRGEQRDLPLLLQLLPALLSGQLQCGTGTDLVLILLIHMKFDNVQHDYTQFLILMYDN